MDKNTAGIIVILSLMLFFGLGTCTGYKMHRTVPCSEVRIVHDTTYRTIPVTEIKYYPEVHSVPARVKHLSREYDLAGLDLLQPESVRQIVQADTDTVIYVDSLFAKNEFRAIIRDTISRNKIIGRGTSFANLAPILERDIETKTTIKHEAWVKVFPCISLQGGKVTGKYTGDVGAGLAIVAADRYLIAADYKFINQQVGLLLGVKLSFKKK
jgi:hypothetical protein